MPHVKTRAEILALVNSVRGRHVLRLVTNAASVRIRAYESEHGKSASYRLAQDMLAKQERLRMLGLTLNDIRRLRGIIPDPDKQGEASANGQ